MAFGFGRGGGYGRGGGRGSGGGGGMGFGFRGSSPPWPYVGRGRGGLPRCGYFVDAHNEYISPVINQFRISIALPSLPFGNRQVEWWQKIGPENRLLKGQAYLIAKRSLDIFLVGLTLPLLMKFRGKKDGTSTWLQVVKGC